MNRKQQHPEPTCGAYIFNPEGKLLLVKSHKWNNRYTVPGGHIELGETLESALKREVKEETGLDVYDIEFICFQEFIFDEVFWEKRHFIFFDFSCKTDSTEIKLNSEHQDYKWLTIEEALKLIDDPYTMRALKEYIKAKQYPLNTTI